MAWAGQGQACGPAAAADSQRQATDFQRRGCLRSRSASDDADTENSTAGSAEHSGPHRRPHEQNAARPSYRRELGSTASEPLNGRRLHMAEEIGSDSEDCKKMSAVSAATLSLKSQDNSALGSCVSSVVPLPATGTQSMKRITGFRAEVQVLFPKRRICHCVWLEARTHKGVPISDPHESELPRCKWSFETCHDHRGQIAVTETKAHCERTAAAIRF